MARQPQRRPDPDIYAITAARRGHEVEMRERMVKYAISMAVRTACFVLAFVVEGPLQWVFITGAVLLPYVAVLIANAGREQTPQEPGTLIGRGSRTALGAEPAPAQRGPGPAPRNASTTADAPATAGAAADDDPAPGDDAAHAVVVQHLQLEPVRVRDVRHSG